MTALPTDQIDIRADARAIDDAAVSGLAESIADVGLINPIRVRATGDRWEVIAGAHRLMAFRKLGLVDIEVSVVTDDDLHAELAMIDENLMRRELSMAERAASLSRRRELYNAIHQPITGHGGDRRSDQVNSGQSVDTFAEHTAAATGMSERMVYKHVDRGSKIIQEAMSLLKGTKLDSGPYLDKIKGLSPNDQVTAVKRDLAHLRQQERERKSGIARRIKVVEPIDSEDAKEKQVAALMAAWNKAGQEAREEFLARIDTPVMDRSAA